MEHTKGAMPTSRWLLLVTFLRTICCGIRAAWKDYGEASRQLDIATITKYQERFDHTNKATWLRVDCLAFAIYWMMAIAISIACVKGGLWVLSGHIFSLLEMPFFMYFMAGALLLAALPAFWIVFVRRYNPFALGYRRDFDYIGCGV